MEQSTQTPQTAEAKKPTRGAKALKLGVPVILAVITAFWLLKPKAPVPAHDAHAEHAEHAEQNSHAEHDGHAKSALPGFKQALLQVHDKVVELSRAENENEKLKLENQSLRQWVEQLKFDCRAGEAKEKTHQTALKLQKETGSRVGRVLETIQYRPPTHLLPSQLYTLSATYLKVGETEKAAVILTYLTGLENDSTFKTPENYLLTGVLWYRLSQFEASDFYFDQTLSMDSEKEEQLKYSAQARLWKALVAQRTGHRELAQQWMWKLMDHHPHSKEATWINSGEAERVPSSTH